MIPTRIPVGNLDLVSGLIFLLGISMSNSNPEIGLFLMGLAILKQFSGR